MSALQKGPLQRLVCDESDGDLRLQPGQGRGGVGTEFGEVITQSAQDARREARPLRQQRAPAVNSSNTVTAYSTAASQCSVPPRAQWASLA